MSNIIVVGAQWGDEGKAKITDLLAEQSDVILRTQGGCNAGHTVHVGEDRFKFHLLPSGMLYQGKFCIIGNGTVIYPPVLLAELESLKNKGYDVNQLYISNRAHITLPFHLHVDHDQETYRAQSEKIGTTGKGIGPTYMDKVCRLGLRMHELYEEGLHARLAGLLRLKQLPEAMLDDLHATCREWADALVSYVCDTTELLAQQKRLGKSFLFEGAQGTLLDIDHGTYPFVTSSNATAGGACTGSGIGPTRIDAVLGVMKAYTTRVGSGPFPTELHDATGDFLTEQGQEYGTTTGRRRRCGWFDAVLGRYSARVNGLDGLAITKLDVLDSLSTLSICVGYRIDGQVLTAFPASAQQLAKAEPVYEQLPGWQQDTTQARCLDELPQAAQVYLNRLAELMETPISLVSVGPERRQTLVCIAPANLTRLQNTSLTSVSGSGTLQTVARP